MFKCFEEPFQFDSLDKVPFKFGHRLVGHPALSLPNLERVIPALPKDNVVVEGKLWSDPERPEISIERDFAHDMNVRVGSKVVYDVQGVPYELCVTSLRTVDWKTFGINFFLVVEPGVLDRAPQMHDSDLIRIVAHLLVWHAHCRTETVDVVLARTHDHHTLVRVSGDSRFRRSAMLVSTSAETPANAMSLTTSSESRIGTGSASANS